MRLAITVLVAVVVLAGPIPALASCSSGSGGGGLGAVVTPIAKLPGKIFRWAHRTWGFRQSSSAQTTTVTNSTTNITNNFFTATAQNGQAPTAQNQAAQGTPTNQAMQGTTTAAATTPTDQATQGTTTAAATTPTVALGPSGGFGGGGGGVGGLGGGFSGGSSVGGSPINPSSELGGVQMFASGGTSSGGGSTSPGDPIALTSLATMAADGETGNFVMAASDRPGVQPLTPSLSMASLPSPIGGGSDDLMTVAMVSARTAPSTGSDGFGFDGPASTSGSHHAGYASTTMLAALIGVGMLGAGWAWKSLGI
jgi:hypothetical protein